MTIRDDKGPRTFFGHPIGLTNLFGVELWERFSFYGMLTILAYYLYYSVTDGGLELPKSTATGIVGAYGGLVYLSTVLGGWIADRVLGMERTVFYGGVVVMIGHIALAVIPGLTGVGVGLVCVALGSGALKANASSLLGTLYDKGDARAEALRLADAFRARVIDATTESFVFELTGAPRKIDDFVELMRPIGLVEVSRTGVAAISRGPEPI